MATTAFRVYRVTRVVREQNAGVTLVFDGSLPSCAGQFVMVWLPGVEERPFTVMNDEPLMLAVARVGPFSQALCALGMGDAVWVRGPYGRGFESAGQRPLLVGGGSGIASMALLAKVLCHAGQDVTVALGARTSDLMMLVWRFGELGCRLVLSTDDGSMGSHGSVVEAVSGTFAEGAIDAVYGCGPEPMLRALVHKVAQVQDALGRSIPCQVSLEAEMKCGVGICGNCHHGERLVCKDGPVFDASQIWPRGSIC